MFCEAGAAVVVAVMGYRRLSSEVLGSSGFDNKGALELVLEANLLEMSNTLLNHESWPGPSNDCDRRRSLGGRLIGLVRREGEEIDTDRFGESGPARCLAGEAFFGVEGEPFTLSKERSNPRSRSGSESK